MSFFRTSSGIENQPLFHRKSFIVYVEEEPNLDPGKSLDIPFWRRVFRDLFPEQSFEFKGLGGKYHVLQMADLIISKSIPNSLCALDSDYDGLFSAKLDDERVFYTHGYGAENDLLCPKIVSTVVSSLISGVHDTHAICQSAKTNLEHTIQREKYAFLSDKIAHARESSTLDRTSSQSVLNNSLSTPPVKFRRTQIYKEIRKCKCNSVIKSFAYRPINNHLEIPAHLYFEIVYKTIVDTIRPYSIVKYSKSVILRMFLITFESAGLDHFCGDTKSHYVSYLDRSIEKYSSLSPS